MKTLTQNDSHTRRRLAAPNIAYRCAACDGTGLFVGHGEVAARCGARSADLQGHGQMFGVQRNRTDIAVTFPPESRAL